MAKYYLYDKVVDSVLSPSRLYKFNKVANARSGDVLNVIAILDDKCYTHYDYWDGNTICLGRNFYKEAWDIGDRIPIMDIRQVYKHMGFSYIGVFYHELAHVLYTDMSYMFDLLEYVNRNFREFAQPVMNILEDITVEGSLKKSYPYVTPYLDTLNSMHSRESIVKTVSDNITKEPNNPGTLLSFLLLLSRGFDISALPRYELYENNKAFIKWGAVKCINTVNARLRHKRQLAYAQQLCKILNLEIPEQDAVENPKDCSKETGPSTPINDSSSKALQPFKMMSQEGNTRVRTKAPEQSDSEVVDKELKQIKASRQDPTELTQDEKDSCGDTDLSEAAISMIANDEPVSRYSHRSDRLDNYCSTSKYLKEYNYYVEKHKKEIGAVVTQIRKMKAQNNSGWAHYKMTGKFDTTTAYKKGNYKFFKQRKAPAPETDLVVEILVDNSGSMGGKKSKLAGEALIIFCEALNRLHIPFAVDAFTEGRSCITIKLKEFTDDYNRVKTNMTLFTEQFSCDKLNTFCGNIDEVNLRYVRDILNKQHQKDKMCIVISDGATCGDWKTLRKVAKNMEDSGVLMLGVGIFDDNVSKIYDNHIILKTTQDLEKLARFLNIYLVRHIFK